jgi:hypothetical protein
MMGAARHARLRRRFYAERVGTNSAERGAPQNAFRDARGTERCVHARARVRPTPLGSSKGLVDEAPIDHLRQLQLAPDDN